MWAYTLTAPMRSERIDAPEPTEDDLQEGEVILRFLAGGICGSDLPRYRGEHAGEPSFRGEVVTKAELGYGTPGYPLHEIVGEVVASRSQLEVGTRVVGWAGGVRGLAEYSISTSETLAEVTAELDDAHAVTIQPLACILYALSRVPGIEGSHAAVIGLGPIGVLFAHGLKTLGASRVTGVDRIDRSDVAEAFGIDEFVHRSVRDWATSLAPSERPDVVVEAVGHQVGTLNDAITAAAMGGHIYYFGVPDDHHYPMAFNAFMRKDLTLQAGTTRGRSAALVVADEYVRKYPEFVDAYVTDIVPVERAPEAYVRANNPRPGQLKVVIDLGR